MKTTTGFIDRSAMNLTTYSTRLNQKKQSRLLTAWGKIWYSLVSGIIRGSEPQVRQISNRDGYLLWHVYDPTTGNSAQFSSEREVRIWLEQRYYS